MLTIKTGMQSEYQVAKQYAAPGTLILTGEQTVDTLQKAVPTNCDAIISFGLCGGLSPQAQIGQAFICDTLVTPDGTFQADVAWRKRLFAATKYYERHWWSSGNFNTANTIAERAQLLAQTGCWVIDDETYAVAEFAKARGIAFQALRTVSDGAEDNLPQAVIDALNPDGTDDVEAVILSVIEDPVQIPDLLKTAQEYYKSLAELNTAAISIGPQFQWGTL
jgi:adenosylhomocysteine nucleosidase